MKELKELLLLIHFTMYNEYDLEEDGGGGGEKGKNAYRVTYQGTFNLNFSQVFVNFVVKYVFLISVIHPCIL